MVIFQNRLRYLREEHGIKQEDMAKKLNISTSAYGYYEQGRNEPSLDSIKKMADIFDVSVDYLLGIIDTKKHPFKLSNEIALSHEDLETVLLLKKLQLLDDMRTAPTEQVSRLNRLWLFIKNEINLEKNSESE
ncbi:helix-turn-helix domain-containing protein [Gracilibacillus alcaliphilus]|uniref:helix-turn-helix domain-containing protein n=1 Tax=Gracilibacillus alcaliphilus TaxID=1401441 RepID=UPI0019594E32|nr:helix-turn-helix domain-containing protein [Gracilibacillus alcaliphilus]MBM7677008.1 transcriptional regulator with XRE-family HTH domain [Gracilibacillus alcaliphilus]